MSGILRRLQCTLEFEANLDCIRPCVKIPHLQNRNNCEMKLTAIYQY